MDAAGPLRGTVALVLGASGIVGGGVADGLIKAGARVLAPCRSESSKAKMMEHLEHSQSPLLEAPVVDYSSEAGLADLVEYVQTHADLQGHVDHIFSCQGGSVPKGPLSAVAEAELEAAVRDRIVSQALSARYLAPLVKPGGDGCYLVATGRLGEGCTAPEWGIYTIVNAAVYGVVSAIRSEYSDIRVQELRIGAIVRRDGEKAHHQWPDRDSVPASVLAALVVDAFLGRSKELIVRYPSPAA